MLKTIEEQKAFQSGFMHGLKYAQGELNITPEEAIAQLEEQESVTLLEADATITDVTE